MANTLIRALLIAIVVIIAGCGARGGGLTDVAPVEFGSELPAVDELARAASGYATVSGDSFVRQSGGEVEDSDLVLTYIPPDIVGGGPTGPGLEKQLAYAVYAVDGVALQPMTLEIRVGYDNDAIFWLGFADWQSRKWDFSGGYHYDTVLLGIDSLPGGVERFVSPEGRIGLAVILLEENVPLRIHFVEVTTATESQNLTASDDRWDGVQLAWEGEDTADGFSVFRRPAAEPEAPWEQLTEEPLSEYYEEYLDTSAVGGLEYEYRLSTGFWRLVQGAPQWFWSAGLTTVGKRMLAHIELDAAQYWPANMWNFLSFFHSPADAPLTIEGVRSTSYPPDDGWVTYDETTDGFGGFELSALAGFGRPFALHQGDSLDNPTLSLVFSLEAGVVCQVATITAEGDVEFESPFLLREAGQHLLGIIRMPRRIGAVTWNPDLSRIELVDSIDMIGRDWYPHDPENIGWHVVGDREPDGPLEMRFFGGGERITYRERGSGELLSYVRKSQWEDISPGLVCGPGPSTRIALNGFSLPGYALIYLTPDGKRIKMVRQNTAGDWLTGEIVNLVIAKGESTISEFKLLTSDEVSYQNYLVYVQDGQLYLRYTEYASFAGLDNAILVDDAAGISDLDVIKIGSGENWSSLKFVTYFSDGPAGERLLNFRNMDMVRQSQ